MRNPCLKILSLWALFLVVFLCQDAVAYKVIITKSGVKTVGWPTWKETYLVNKTGAPANALTAIKAAASAWAKAPIAAFTLTYGGQFCPVRPKLWLTGY